jgi:hypothetical protein
MGSRRGAGAINDGSVNAMNCAEFHDAWQRFLDDRADALPSAMRAHGAACAECRTWLDALHRFQNAFPDAAPAPSPGLVPAIFSQIDAQRRRARRSRQMQVLALAAAILVAILIGYPWLVRRTSSTLAQPLVVAAPPAPSIRDNVEGAASAIAGILSLTAEQAVRPGRVILPDEVALPLWRQRGARLAPDDVPIPTLERARHGVAEFGPVASIGRFVNYFMQDLPGRPPAPDS